MLFNAHLSNGRNFVELVVTEKWIFQIQLCTFQLRDMVTLFIPQIMDEL